MYEVTEITRQNERLYKLPGTLKVQGNCFLKDILEMFLNDLTFGMIVYLKRQNDP